jgi:hypothetical protein
LGILSGYLPFKADLWPVVIRNKVKAKFVDINLVAFERGCSLAATVAK